MDIVHACIQYSNLQNIAKYRFRVPTMTKFHIFARFISLTYKMHEGEIDSPHKDPLYHIFTSQVFFIRLCSPSVCEENKQIENISTWEDAVFIMQTFT